MLKKVTAQQYPTAIFNLAILHNISSPYVFVVTVHTEAMKLSTKLSPSVSVERKLNLCSDFINNPNANTLHVSSSCKQKKAPSARELVI